MLFKWIYIVVEGIVLFLSFIAEQFFIVEMHTPHLLYPCIHGHFGCFHVLATVNSASMKLTCLFQLQCSLCRCPGVGLLDNMVTLVFKVFKNLHAVLHSGCITLHWEQ